jgi:putative nucleotidyltransferase with HDIG domain
MDLREQLTADHRVREADQRQDSIIRFRKGGREDLVAQEQAEKRGIRVERGDRDHPSALRLRLRGRKVRLPALLWVTIFVLLFAVMVGAVLASQSLSSNQVTLREGQVSPVDIRAPQRLTYVSQILTERAQEQAAARVEPVYDPPDAQVVRGQVEKARQIVAYIDACRHDDYASAEEKDAMLEAIEGLQFSSLMRSRILDLSPADWQRVAEETVRVLSQAMRQEIRPNGLSETRRRVPTLIALDLNDVQAAIVVEIAGQLTQPNSLYNAELTEKAQQQARESVQPINRTWKQDEVILRQGEIVDTLTLEALEAFGLRQPENRWPSLLGIAGFSLVLALLLGLYLLRLEEPLYQRARLLVVLLLLNGLFLVGIRLMVPGHVVLSHLFPLATLGILLSVLINPHLALLVALLMSLIGGFMAERSFEIAVYLLLGSIIGILQVQKVERLNTFIWAAVSIGAVHVAVVLTFGLSRWDMDLTGLLTLSGAGVVNGGFSASLALAGFLLLGQAFDVLTPLQLLELARPDHPLLQQLMLRAPGTYHHTLLVSNMAEQAAQAIGADALLTRVGAYYHDVGKTVRPYFFVENQVAGMNVHDRLDPRTSAQIVISHVSDGLALARKHRLPSRIAAFIPEHHGTAVQNYFYHAAKEQAEDGEQVREEDYRYPGPAPQSKETAILMLADSCEAAARASQINDPDEIESLVQKIIQAKVTQGDLDESNLTLRDLGRIRDVFVSFLQGIRHPRIEYPEEPSTESD